MELTTESCHRDRRRDIEIAVWLVACVAYYAVVRWHLWRYLAVPARPEPFLDLRHLLSNFAAYAAGMNVFEQGPPGEWVSQFNYPAAWLVFSWLPLQEESASWLGPLLMAAALAAAVDVIRPLRPTHAALTLAFLLSPAVAFGFERGNGDVLIFLLVWAAWRLLSRTGTGTRHAVASVSTLTLAGILKFYPLAAIPVALARTRTLRGALIAGSIAASGIAVAAYEWWAIRELLPRPVGRYAFGGSLLLDGLGLEPSGTSTILAAVAVLSLALWLYRRHPRLRVVSHPARVDALLLGGSLLGFCFLATVGYDYRLILACLLMPWAWDLVGQRGRARVLGGLWVAGILVIVWAEFFDLTSRLVLLRLGASAEDAVRVQPFVQGAEHAFTWLFMALVLAHSMQVGWARIASRTGAESASKQTP